MMRFALKLAARRVAMTIVLVSITALPALAQFGKVPPPEELVKISAEPVSVAAGGEATVTFRLAIAPTWHINANPPFPDYMIPTVLELDGMPGVRIGAPAYPAPHMVKLGFDESELFVYDGSVNVTLPLSASTSAVNGSHTLEGKLRFQACDDQVCLAPTSLPVAVTVTVSGGREATSSGAAGGADGANPLAGGAAGGDGARAPPGGELGDGGALDLGDGGDDVPPAGTGFTTAPPANAGSVPAIENPIAKALEKGSFATFITLFLIGLALNLTPCVYPMMGVTVSIFGARGKAPPLQAFGMALVYVLGIALMYSVLGLVAALSGGLFGGALQSPIVLVVIGLLLVGLSLSMFGLYELQLPAGLMSRLGGQTATGALGVFASGLMVGIFAAPCIGPPIVALLAIVGAKGDPVFGFTSFFILSMGLGAPYLVLGTFSNLLSSLPKSGEWMIWVKKVFGIVLLSIGLFYALLALAPTYAFWVAPVALLLGGVYLGFVEKSKGRTAMFGRIKKAGGVTAILAGVYMMSAVMPSKSIAFEEFNEARLQAALQSGTPVLMDFSADWCVPCHELDRFTFTDQRVIAAAVGFKAFKVDLTRYDSPEAERWRQQYDITGVPTVLFLTPDGQEVRAARVEGFLPPEPFLERLEVAVGARRTAGREPGQE